MPVVHRHLPILLAVIMLATGCGAPRGAVPQTPGEPAGAAEIAAEEPETAAGEPETLEEFWPDGSIRLRRQVIRDAEGQLVDHGLYTRWHENGRLEYETVFDHGRKNGRAVRWHMNGEKWVEEVYAMGLKEGASRTWNEDGELVKEEHYARGRPDGVWTVWEDGVVRARSCFDNGVPVDCPPKAAPE